MAVLLAISFLLVVLFVGATIWRIHDIPVSISSMVYSLPKSMQWLWTAWIWAVSLTLAPSLLDALGRYSFLGFLTVACLLFCGAMPLVKHEKNTLHNVFGVAAGILSQACVVVISPWWLLLWLLMLPFIIGAAASINDAEEVTFADGKGTFIVESICFLTLFMALIAS